MHVSPTLHTGQRQTFNAQGEPLAELDPVQDGPHAPGRQLETGRFVVQGDVVEDRLTGLHWPQQAQPFGTSLRWAEAAARITDWNAEARFGHADWRLPTRRELRTLIDHSRARPALPAQHPFLHVFPGWHWTATTWADDPRYAWRLQLEGGRLFFGQKEEEAIALPVRGRCEFLPATGDPADVPFGTPWPEPRFTLEDGLVRDHLTNLLWDRDAGGMRMTTWNMALSLAHARRQATGQPWRLPTINELETLVDASRAYPALPTGHPFGRVADACWSGTSSGLDPAWAYCLYTGKGAVGVGYKPHPEFTVWLVC
ncbi:Lcl C-terminal domain-containing protein [Megalodesulfovibrio paquesii]